MTAKPKPLAYSYVRFSTPEQAGGDSLRRQTEATKSWCERHNVRLDESTTLMDLGKSAFTGAHRKNPDRHALAGFLKLVESGKVPKGSYLVIENLDRLTREHERAALRLWMDLLDQGINIVQLTPETIFRHERSEMTDIIRAIIELSRGHGESARKSERNKAAWESKLARAREGKDQSPRRATGRITRAITSLLPAWIKEEKGKMVLIPERVAVVKRIFNLAAKGYGMTGTVKRLTADGVPAFGPSGVWIKAYVASILKDRRAVGEYQPRGTDRKPAGEPIRDYYPAVVTETEWAAAREGAAQRKQRPGRTGSHVNLFSGMLRNVGDGDTYITVAHSKSYRVLVNNAGAEARAPYRSFPSDSFEWALLTMLREIDPREIIGDGDDEPDEVAVLSGKLAGLETSIAMIVKEMDDHGESPTLFKRLRNKEEEQRRLARLLADARQKAASPLSESWGEYRSLASALYSVSDSDREATRLRLRSLLRRLIDEIWMLILPSGGARLALVQVWFADGERCRSYLIHHTYARTKGATRRDAEVWVKSMPEAAGLDLRQPVNRKALRKWVSALYTSPSRRVTFLNEAPDDLSASRQLTVAEIDELSRMFDDEPE